MLMSAIRIGLLAAFLAAVPTTLFAQCSFGHPGKAGKIQTSLTQAFVFCSPDGTGSAGVLPNDATEGGIPACSPPETFGQLSGNYTTAWRFDPLKGTGQVQLKTSSAFPPNVLNPPGNSADVDVMLKLHSVFDGLGPASGTGRLVLLLRATLDDRVGGDMTIVDLPLNAPVPLTFGKATVRTSIDSMLNGAPLNQPGLPGCASLEVLFVGVDDPDGDDFANGGVYLP
jgi:hypothetical protein